MFKKLIVVLCLIGLLTGQADARRICPILCGGGLPSWVKPGAAVDMDFADGLYFGGTPASLLSITRASAKSNLLPSSASGFPLTIFGNNVLAITPGLGLLVEESRTNQLLNSTVPATQTTASLGTGTYTLWVNGAGSALASGGTATITGAGSATNGAPNTFTITVAGTVVVTVTGALNFFQLEAGSTGTSGIVTAGATATRAADNISIVGAAQAVLSGVNGSLISYISNLANGNAANSVIVDDPSRATPALAFNTLVTFNGAQQLNGASTVNWTQLNKVGFTWAATPARQLVLNGGTVSSDAFAKAASSTYVLGSVNFGGGFLNGYMARLSLFAAALSSTTIKAFTS